MHIYTSYSLQYHFLLYNLLQVYVQQENPVLFIIFWILWYTIDVNNQPTGYFSIDLLILEEKFL